MPKRIEWDKTGERFLEMGVDHVVLYRQDTDGAYPAGVPWNGVTSITESPSGAEANDFYADNIKYGSIRSAETYGATIEAYQSPEEFDECDGSAEVAKGVMIHQQKRVPFGICYRTLITNDTASDTDDGYLIHIIWNATASPSEKNRQTINESPDAVTMSWEIDTTPINVSGHRPTASMTISSLKADPTKLKTLEDTLYGSTTADAKLPLPDEIIEMMKES